MCLYFMHYSSLDLEVISLTFFGTVLTFVFVHKLKLLKGKYLTISKRMPRHNTTTINAGKRMAVRLKRPIYLRGL